MLLSRDWPLLGLLFARTSAGSVEVRVATQLAVPPADARAAWLDYAWARGGGLPGTATLLEDGGQSRTLLPVFLKERLVATQAESEIGYSVTDAGPALADVVPGSHSAVVSFSPRRDGTEMVWEVEFETRARRDFWAAFTRTSVGEVSSNLASFVQPEREFTLSARLAGSPEAAVGAWLQCLDDGDLGVPMPPHVVVSRGDESRAGYERLILPPGLRERVTRVERTALEYTVLNPAWRTCYPAHTHRGEVAFALCEDAGGGACTRMVWRVCVRPQRYGRWAVELLTTLIVPAFARNLAARRASDEGREVDAGVEWCWS